MSKSHQTAQLFLRLFEIFQLLLNFVIYPHYHFKCCCYRHYLDSLHLLMCLTCFIFLFVHSFISVLHPYLIQFRVTLDTLPHPLDSFLSSFPSFFLSFVPLPFNFFFSPPYLMHRSYNSSLVSVNTTAPLSHRPSILSFPTPNHLLPFSSPPFLQYFLHNLALRTVGNIVTGDDAQTQLVINLNALPALLWMLDNRYVREGGCDRVRESACVRERMYVWGEEELCLLCVYYKRGWVRRRVFCPSPLQVRGGD